MQSEAEKTRRQRTKTCTWRRPIYCTNPATKSRARSLARSQSRRIPTRNSARSVSRPAKTIHASRRYLQKKATAPPKTSAVPQACPADQIWNGIQCAPVGAQGCLPGQTGAGPSCQTDCTIATAGAQNYIERLRMARQAKDQACTGNSTQQECQQAESTYNIRLNEYRTLLAGVSTACTLPDPISI